MQYFSRSVVDTPEYFQSEIARYRRMQLLEFFSANVTRQTQSLLERARDIEYDPSILDALTRLFRGKCAFCERAAKSSLHRFRPPAEASPNDGSPRAHLYYSWLGEAWQNLYPICDECRPLNSDFFPVRRRRCPLPDISVLDQYVKQDRGIWPVYPPSEAPLLLEPCQDKDYHRNLGILSNGQLVSLSRRGTQTIEHFNLNRHSLVVQRREELLDRLTKLLGIDDQQSFEEFVDFERQQFGGLFYLLLRQLGLQIGGNPSDVSRDNIQQFFYYFVFSKTLVPLPELFARMDKSLLERRQQGAQPAAPRHAEGNLTRIHIRNFKSLEDVRIDIPEELAASDAVAIGSNRPALLLVGENSAGKSSLLEAVALAGSDAAAVHDMNLDPDDFILDPRYLGAKEAIDRDAAFVHLTFSTGDTRDILIASGFVHEDAEANALPPIFAYGAFRHFRREERKYSASKHIRSLFRSDYILSNPEKWLLKLDDKNFNMVVRSLRGIFAIESDFEVIERDFRERRCMVISAVENDLGESVYTEVPLDQVSSGFRTVLAMVCDIMQGLMDERVYRGFETFTNARAIVLIDEIEAHLHPRWKMQIMGRLREALPNVTFIATTHDPLCIRGMNDGEVLALRRIASDMSATPGVFPVMVEIDNRFPPLSTLTLDQLLTSDLFELFSTDSIVLEREFARMADILAKRQSSGGKLSPRDQAILDRFATDVAKILPIGATESERIVHEALAEHLERRRSAGKDQLAELTEQARATILQALDKI